MMCTDGRMVAAPAAAKYTVWRLTFYTVSCVTSADTVYG